MFEPYRCEDCVYGEFLESDSVWDCSIGITDDEECERNYADDEKM